MNGKPGPTEPSSGRPVSLDEKFGLFDDHWSPRIVGQVNDMHVKVVKVLGEFVWHTHDETDELFLVHAGELTIEQRNENDVVLGPGDMYIVSRGVEHRPVAAHECQIVLMEPAGVVNTGDAAAGGLTAPDQWI